MGKINGLVFRPCLSENLRNNAKPDGKSSKVLMNLGFHLVPQNRYEWLDPSIRKVEWSREEEEKLLHLAKLMPTQWRTIAQAMNGRTAAQCMEHYEKLLNAVQDPEDAMNSSDDPRRLRPGEIDPNPETKPARPDPIDMDEDEKEMLQEARARLANTKGKKAKRKIREKQLEEARRLASLQKRRELKAAGITLRFHHKRKHGIDYNKEIPFERPVPAGFFEVATEDERDKQTPVFRSALLQRIDEQADKRRDRQENEARKKDIQKFKLKKQFDTPNTILQINKLNDPQQLVRRSKLNLPKPQMSESELESIVKMQQSGAPMLLEPTENTPTQTLLSSYKEGAQTPALGNAAATPFRTPARTPLGKQQALLNEARNLVALSNTTTPLEGDVNVPLAPSDFTSTTPRPSTAVTQTPNPLLTPRGTQQGMATPRGFMTPGTPASMVGRTPVRDVMGINPSGEMAEQERAQAIAIRNRLRQGLASLPTPQNEYGVEIPEDMLDDPEDEQGLEEDAEEIEKRRKARKFEMEQKELKKRSQVLQRNLPRPRVVNSQPPPQSSDRTLLQQADDLIRTEANLLIMSDAYRYPVPGGPKNVRPVAAPEVPENEIAAAQAMISAELDSHSYPSEEEFEKIWNETIDEFIFVPAQKRYVRISAVSRPDRLAAQQQVFELIRTQMVNDTKRAMKLENKLKILTGGYQHLATKHLAQAEEQYTTLDQSRLELSCFSSLAAQEAVSMQRRKQELTEWVQKVRDRENELQKEYAKLMMEVADSKREAQDMQ
eukprot:c9227_g1_i1.p1 GENE.c9227_g1_i1~~c9227_g1_i1.p1  ORF type:complete len:776 (+),score=222.31 c9227_g1_i1:157-2484(+)